MMKGKASHDAYIKKLLGELYPFNYYTDKYYTRVKYGGSEAQIDGVLIFRNDMIAIEAESRTAKQVRGAFLDLFFHRARKKLLIIIPMHMNNPYAVKQDAKYVFKIFKQIKPDTVFKTIILEGTGDNHKPEEDKEIIRNAVNELRNTE